MLYADWTLEYVILNFNHIAFSIPCHTNTGRCFSNLAVSSSVPTLFYLASYYEICRSAPLRKYPLQLGSKSAEGGGISSGHSSDKLFEGPIAQTISTFGVAIAANNLTRQLYAWERDSTATITNINISCEMVSHGLV